MYKDFNYSIGRPSECHTVVPSAKLTAFTPPAMRVFVAIGALYLYGIMLQPAFSAVLMSVSTVIVDVNASLLKRNIALFLSFPHRALHTPWGYGKLNEQARSL